MSGGDGSCETSLPVSDRLHRRDAQETSSGATRAAESSDLEISRSRHVAATADLRAARVYRTIRDRDAGSDESSADLFAMPDTASRSVPVVIGLVGGIASGKSTVAGLLAEAGLIHVDADALARAATAEPAVRDAIVDRFGPNVVDDSGRLDRAALARVVFGDPARLQQLNAIVHPVVRARILADLAAARAAARSVVLDAPLLLEGGLIELCDAVIFVDTPDAVRRERARARGWDDAELARRESRQASLVEKKSRAGYTIRNDRPLHEIRTDLMGILDRIQGRTQPPHP